jgi:hypothetical protein
VIVSYSTGIADEEGEVSMAHEFIAEGKDPEAVLDEIMVLRAAWAVGKALGL